MSYRGVAAVFAVVCALGASSDVARAQDFPNRPITFVVPYAVGGTVDVQLRALAGTTGSTVHCRKQAKRNRHSRAGSGRNLSQAGWLPRKCISMSQSGHCSGLVIFLLKVNNTALIPRPSQSYPIRICGSPT